MSRRKEIQAQIVAQIISELENGTKPWLQPWKSAMQLPYSFITKNSYLGVNLLVLWFHQANKKYQSSAWLTYKQAKELGGQVRKGEKSMTCFYYKKVEVDDKFSDEKKLIPFRKNFSLFNLDQIDGIDYAEKVIVATSSFKANKNAEIIIDKSKANLEHGMIGAYYLPTEDKIFMPNKSDFHSAEDYYASVLHELVHWTGHDDRLARNSFDKCHTERYAFEELVAEMGSAFLCAELGIYGELQHASYISNWLQLLANDDSALFRAASLASQAHQYIMRFLPETTESPATV